MKCYLGGDCIHTVEMLRYLDSDSDKRQSMRAYNGKVPFRARVHCMKIDCSVYEKVCLLADEYRTFRTTHL